MSDPSPFENCWQRVVRAEAHSNAIAQCWNEVLEEEVYLPFVNVESNGTGRIWVKQTTSVPSVLGFFLGEALYQLRAALDGTVYEAAILESGQDTPPDENRLEFPICTTKIEFEKAAWKIRPLSDERKAIIEAVQPYNAPELAPDLQLFNFNISLSILHDWARKDRHRRLHIIGCWASDLSPRIRLPDGVTLRRSTINKGGFFERENQVATFELEGWADGLTVQANPNLTIDIAVNETPFPRSPSDTLGLRLEAMIRATGFVISKFEESFGIRRE